MNKFLFVFLTLFSSSLFAQSMAVLPKLESTCPTNYRTSSGYCVPNNTITKYYVPKVTSTCPTRYRTDGTSGYCISLDDNVLNIPVLKTNNNCPFSYRTDGVSGYCIK